jgi:hypothetical protein
MTEIEILKRKDKLEIVFNKDGLRACLAETKSTLEVDMCRSFGDMEVPGFGGVDEGDIKSLKDLTVVTKQHIDSLKKKKPEIIKDPYEGDINVTKMYYEELGSVLYNAEKVIEKIEKRGWTVLMQRQPDITKEMIALHNEPGRAIDREYVYEKITERHSDVDVSFLGELSYDVRGWVYKR